MSVPPKRSPLATTFTAAEVEAVLRLMSRARLVADLAVVMRDPAIANVQAKFQRMRAKARGEGEAA